jgi:hypothetical protein
LTALSSGTPKIKAENLKLFEDFDGVNIILNCLNQGYKEVKNSQTFKRIKDEYYSKMPH